MTNGLARRLRKTSWRAFSLYPALVAADHLRTRRRLRLRWAPLLAWGFLQYRLAGDYRTERGGGGPGMAIPPDRIVDTGIYRYTRNPMYLGHLIFLTGLAAMSRSPLAAGLLIGNIAWYDRHAREDERRLEELFGDEYRHYRDSVPRWVPRPPRSR